MAGTNRFAISAGESVRTRLQTLARDHLQRAYYILQGDDDSADVRRLIARTLDVMDRDPERDLLAGDPPAKVVRFRPPATPRSLPSGALVRGRRLAPDS